LRGEEYLYKYRGVFFLPFFFFTPTGLNPGYIAPEIYHTPDDSEYDNKVDIWSLGYVILRLLGLTLPRICAVDQDSWDRGFGQVIERGVRFDLDAVRIKAFKTARRMADYSPRSRPSAAKCYSLPLFEADTVKEKKKPATRKRGDGKKLATPPTVARRSARNKGDIAANLFSLGRPEGFRAHIAAQEED